MVLSDYEAKREELNKEMEKLNEMETEKKMELSIKYQKDCKRIQCKIGELKKKKNYLLKDYQNNKAWWHKKFREEKQKVSERMHTLRLEYLTVNNIQCKETEKQHEA